mgnify:CR=1
MKEQIYDVNHFIAKFSVIPEDMWCVRTRSNGTQRCALGWCYPTHELAKESEQIYNTDSVEDKSLVALIHLLNPDFGVGGVNNGIYKEYQQPTPKQRILAALYDVKALQEKENKPAKEIIRYVAVDSVIRTNTIEALVATN